MFFDYLKRLGAYTVYRGKKVLRRTPPTLISYSSKAIIHAPSETGIYPAPITIEGQLERVTGNMHRPVPEVINNAISIEQFHKETTLHRLDNVTYDNGFIFMDGQAGYLSSLGVPRPAHANHQKESILCSTPSGALYFGDWIIMDTLLETIAEECNHPPLKVTPHMYYPHLVDVNKVLALSPHYTNTVTKFDHLYIPEDLGYNKNKVKRLKTLRKRFSDYANNSHKPANNLYILRGGKASPRILSNEKQLTDYLETCGFSIIDPYEMEVDEIVQAVNNSNIVIGVEGSQLSYGSLGINEGGILITLQPPFHFQPSFRPRCASVGVRWGFLVGIENDKGFEIPLDDLKRLLDLC